MDAISCDERLLWRLMSYQAYRNIRFRFEEKQNDLDQVTWSFFNMEDEQRTKSFVHASQSGKMELTQSWLISLQVKGDFRELLRFVVTLVDMEIATALMTNMLCAKLLGICVESRKNKAWAFLEAVSRTREEQDIMDILCLLSEPNRVDLLAMCEEQNSAWLEEILETQFQTVVRSFSEHSVAHLDEFIYTPKLEKKMTDNSTCYRCKSAFDLGQLVRFYKSIRHLQHEKCQYSKSDCGEKSEADDDSVKGSESDNDKEAKAKGEGGNEKRVAEECGEQNKAKCDEESKEESKEESEGGGEEENEGESEEENEEGVEEDNEEESEEENEAEGEEQSEDDNERDSEEDSKDDNERDSEEESEDDSERDSEEDSEDDNERESGEESDDDSERESEEENEAENEEESEDDNERESEEDNDEESEEERV